MEVKIIFLNRSDSFQTQCYRSQPIQNSRNEWPDQQGKEMQQEQQTIQMSEKEKKIYFLKARKRRNESFFV